jgi:hypothetical protein
MMAVAVGLALALAVSLLARATGLDRDRALYPAWMMVIAVLYSLFAVMGGSTHALLLEALAGSVFLIVTIIGFKRSLWLVVGALAAHGLLDVVHARLIPDPGVPTFWPAFCSAYDVMAAAFLAWLLKTGRVPAAPRAA